MAAGQIAFSFLSHLNTHVKISCEEMKLPDQDKATTAAGAALLSPSIMTPSVKVIKNEEC